MLFSNEYAGRNDLFEGLSIWESEVVELSNRYRICSNRESGSAKRRWLSLLLLFTSKALFT